MIRHWWVLAIAALLVSWPAAAQEGPGHPFYPLGIGDTWEYELAYGAAYEPVDLVSYQRRTVLRDTTLDGEAYRLVRVDSVSAEPGYEVLAEALCAVRVTDAGRVEWVAVGASGDADCWLPEASLDMGIEGAVTSQDVYVSGELYGLDVMGVEEGERRDRKVASTAEGFGLVEWIQPEWEETGFPDKFVLRAIYANVQGQAYGHPIGADVWKTFYPLREGDVREYEREWRGPEGGTFRSYERWDVDRDTTINGLGYTLVRQREYDEQFVLVEERTCALRVTESGDVQAQPIGGADQCSTFVSDTWDLRTNTWTVRRASWLGATALTKRYEKYDENSTLRMRVVEGLGVVETYGASNCCGPSSTRGGSGWELKFAVAGGAIYGSPLTPDQPRPGHPFYPLGVGDTWTYELAYGDAYDVMELGGYQRRTVLRDTLIDGDVYGLIRVDSVSAEPGYEVLAEALCAARATDAGRVEWIAVDESGRGACWAPEVALGLDFGAEITSQEVYVNGEPYGLDLVRASDSEYPGKTVTAAGGIGLLSYYRGKWDETVQRDRVAFRVVYAEVGGEAYGHPLGSDVWKAFYPLKEGDIREYANSSTGPQGEDRSAYERWEVGADTTIDGLSYTLVRQQYYNEQLDLVDERACALRVTEDGGVEAQRVSGTGYCSTFVGSWDLRTNTWAIAQNEILGVEAKTKLYRRNDDSRFQSLEIAEGIGVVSTSGQNTSGPGSTQGRSGWELRYAVADGVIYGSPLISEPSDGPTPLTLDSAYPNPFRTTLSLTLSSRLASAEITLEVFDVLGRRVLRRDFGEQPPGDTPHTIGGASWAPGMYIVRVSTTSGESVVRRVVKID